MTKSCIVFYHKHKTEDELRHILEKIGKDYGLHTLPKVLLQEVHTCNGNIYVLMTKCRQYALTGCLKDTTLHDCKIDKNIVSKCFNDLSAMNLKHGVTNKILSSHKVHL